MNSFSDFIASLQNESSVKEIFGATGTGKTIFLLTLSSYIILPTTWNDVQLNGFNKSVLLIDTSHSFSLIQLINILENIICQKLLNLNCDWSENDSESCMQNCLSKFHLLQVDNCKSLSELLTQLDNDDYFRENLNLCAILCDISVSFMWLDKFEGYKDQMNNISFMLNKFCKQYLINIYITRTDTSSIDSNLNLSESILKASQEIIYLVKIVSFNETFLKIVYKDKTELRYRICKTGIALDK